MDQETIDRITELELIISRLEGDVTYYVLRIAHLVGELSKSKIDPSYEPQISVA